MGLRAVCKHVAFDSIRHVSLYLMKYFESSVKPVGSVDFGNFQRNMFKLKILNPR